MKNKSGLFLMLILAGFMGSCINCIKGEGDLVEEKKTLKEFEVLVLKSSADVVIHQNKLSRTCEANVIAQKNIQPYIHATVEGSKLTLDIEGCIETTKNMQIELAFNELSKIIQNSSGDLSSSNILKCDDLKIVQDGSGDLTLKIKGKNLEIDQNGSGDITLFGDYDNLDIECDGSGDVNTKELIAKNVKVHNDGSGSVVVFAKENLDMSLDGSGDISYYGKPVIGTQSDDGSGDIKSME